MSARAFVFGDNISTDALAPGAYMRAPLRELAAHCLESVDARFAAEVNRGDFVVALDNFGMGSSREQAVMALLELGVAAVVARSFAGLFFRNCINLGLPALVCPDAARIRDGDMLACDAATGIITNLTRGEQYDCEPLPPHLLAVLAAGGLLAHIARRAKKMPAVPDAPVTG